MMSRLQIKETARVVVVHDDREFLIRTVNALRDDGHDTTSFSDTMSALDALDAALPFEVLITRVQFPPGQPHGVSLALMVRNKRPGVKILFAAAPERQVYTEGLGEYLPAPIATGDIVVAVERILRGGPH